MDATRPLRGAIAMLHTWIGATVALFLVLVGVSGALLAVVSWVFRVEYGSMLDATGPDVADVDRLLAAAVEGRPGFQITGLLMPHGRIEVDAAMAFGLPAGVTDHHDVVMLPLDPHTATALGEFRLLDAVGHQLLEFHASLLGDELGALFVTVLGVQSALFALSGLWLWWPGRRALAKATRAPRTRGRLKRVLFRLHSFTGFWASLLILYFAATGVGVAEPDWLGLRDGPEAPTGAVATRDCGARVTPGMAARAAEAAHPDARLLSVMLPKKPGAPTVLTLARPGDLDRTGGAITVFASTRCAELVETHAEPSTAELLGGAALSLHGGRSLGIAGVPLVVLGGLALAFLAGSGLWVWAARTFGRDPRDEAPVPAWARSTTAE